jgi:hypothetical protein
MLLSSLDCFAFSEFSFRAQVQSTSKDSTWDIANLAQAIPGQILDHLLRIPFHNWLKYFISLHVAQVRALEGQFLPLELLAQIVKDLFHPCLQLSGLGAR